MILLQEKNSNIKQIIDELSNGRPIIFTNGCFDVIHAGHISVLNYCRSIKLFDNNKENFVVVALNDDDSVKRLKGATRPIFSLIDRMNVVDAIKGVSLVCSFSQNTPYELIKSIKPDAIVKGGDYANVKSIIGSDISPIFFCPFKNGLSTTETLRRLY